MKLLILGGGGTLGAFSAGALQVLLECGWQPDAWIGSSAGGINLLRYYAAGPNAPTAFWRSIGPGELLRQIFTHDPRRGILHPERFRARVDDGVDYEQLFRDRRTFGFVVVDLMTGRVSVRTNRSAANADELRAIAHGAFALPPLLPPVPWERELISDGGLLQNAPLHLAKQLGATEIVYLNNVHALPHEGYEHRSIVHNTWRYADVYFRRASNVGYADAEIVEDRYGGVPFLTISPPATLRFGSILRWMMPTVNAMDYLVEQGRASAKKALSRVSLCTGLRAVAS